MWPSFARDGWALKRQGTRSAQITREMQEFGFAVASRSLSKPPGESIHLPDSSEGPKRNHFAPYRPHQEAAVAKVLLAMKTQRVLGVCTRPWMQTEELLICQSFLGASGLIFANDLLASSHAAQAACMACGVHLRSYCPIGPACGLPSSSQSEC